MGPIVERLSHSLLEPRAKVARDRIAHGIGADVAISVDQVTLGLRRHKGRFAEHRRGLKREHPLPREWRDFAGVAAFFQHMERRTAVPIKIKISLPALILDVELGATMA